MAFEFTGTVMLAETIAATEGTAAALTAFEAMPLAAETLMASAPEFASLGSQIAGAAGTAGMTDRKSTRLNSSHVSESRMPSSA